MRDILQQWNPPNNQSIEVETNVEPTYVNDDVDADNGAGEAMATIHRENLV